MPVRSTIVPALQGRVDRRGRLWNTLSMDDAAPDDLPGYRRRIRVTPTRGAVTAMLEDDMHCMRVTLRHTGGKVDAVEAETLRAPWNTCPDAGRQLVETFAGQPLAEVTARREKRQNCTHLHDLAVLAAAHADDEAAIEYEVLASDPVEGRRVLELRRNGDRALRWVEQDGVLAEPAAAAGQSLLTLRDWIAGLPAAEQEPARVLQWASMVAHGRTIPLDQQSDARTMPPNCYTFQPERAAVADRIAVPHDFSRGGRRPLEGYDTPARE